MFVAAIALMATHAAGHDLALDSLTAIVIGLCWGYFIAFNILEATLPSLISKIAPADARGHRHRCIIPPNRWACFSGRLPGLVSCHLAAPRSFAFCSALMLLWLLMAITITPASAVRTQMLALPDGWQGNLPRCRPPARPAWRGRSGGDCRRARGLPKVAQTGWTKQAPANQSGETQ